MKIRYYPETDSFYIELFARPGADVTAVGRDIRIDLDVSGRAVGISAVRLALAGETSHA